MKLRERFDMVAKSGGTVLSHAFVDDASQHRPANLTRERSGGSRVCFVAVLLRGL